VLFYSWTYERKNESTRINTHFQQLNIKLTQHCNFNNHSGKQRVQQHNYYTALKYFYDHSQDCVSIIDDHLANYLNRINHENSNCCATLRWKDKWAWDRWPQIKHPSTTSIISRMKLRKCSLNNTANDEFTS